MLLQGLSGTAPLSSSKHGARGDDLPMPSFQDQVSLWFGVWSMEHPELEARAREMADPRWTAGGTWGRFDERRPASANERSGWDPRPGRRRQGKSPGRLGCNHPRRVEIGSLWGSGGVLLSEGRAKPPEFRRHRNGSIGICELRASVQLALTLIAMGASLFFSLRVRHQGRLTRGPELGH